jgi:hypothetical protein
MARVDALRRNGGPRLNDDYVAYRVRKIAKGEPAMAYSEFFDRFTVALVRDVAATGRMI